MSLIERIDNADWPEDARLWFAETVARCQTHPQDRDLFLAATAAILGSDGADIFALRLRAREIVDLAQMMQTESTGIPAPGRPQLTVVGGRDD